MHATEHDIRVVKEVTEETIRSMPGFVATAIVLPNRDTPSASLEVTFSSREAAGQFGCAVFGMANDDPTKRLLRSIPLHTKVIGAPRA